MKRRPIQIHLSTCMVLMLVAAVLLGLNTHDFEYEPFVDGYSPHCKGWPAPFNDEPDFQYINFFQCGLDVVINLTILLITAVVSEWRIKKKN